MVTVVLLYTVDPWTWCGHSQFEHRLWWCLSGCSQQQGTSSHIYMYHSGTLLFNNTYCL